MTSPQLPDQSVESSSSRSIIDRMRTCNYEKFKTLVRMHLSFELDLNTDEFDLPCHEIVYEDKGKLKKWSRVSKKHKHIMATSCAASSSAGNSPVEGVHDRIDQGFLMHFEELKEFFLLEKNLTLEGIFRKTGSAARQNELRAQLKGDQKIDLEKSNFSVHDCATVFKGFLADMPEPLLTDAHYPAYSQIAVLCINGALPTKPSMYRQQTVNSERAKREYQLLHSLQLLLLLLPDENRRLLMEIIEILHAVVDYQDFNKMSADNLATLFTPHLVCPRNMPPEALHYIAKRMSAIIAFMILRGMEIFEVPSKLATDIKAYFLERRRKTTMSPEQTLDDSISDISTVNTVYTFVDREKTAAAHSTNTTDTELAQLYAHIQSMPESSKKRRLIKQFNKQNGQGTPLQLVVLNRLKQSETQRSVKSFSNSIKKHIFQKGIMSRTPKRPPINSNNNHPSTLRVLFQSPITECAAAITTQSSSCTQLDSSASKGITLKNGITTKCISQSESAVSTETNRRQSRAELFMSTQYDNTGSVLSSRECSGEDVIDNFPTSSSSPALDDMLTNSPQRSENSVSGWSSTDHIEYSPKNEASISVSLMAPARYKSEPNLSFLIKDKLVDIPEAIDESHIRTAPTCPTRSKSLTHKLIKGVSMSNLRLPFTPESTKRLIRSVSSTLKLRTNDAQCNQQQQNTKCNPYEHATIKQPLLLESTDDESILSLSRSSSSGSTNDVQLCMEEPFETDTVALLGGNNSRFMTTESAVYGKHILRNPNMNVITSTPAWFGRRSMSPITKSTQRMSKAMQESIMTPRSRKPVMLTTTLNSTEQNQTRSTVDGSVLRDTDSVAVTSIQHHDKDMPHNELLMNVISAENALTSDFKEYLRSRSVLTASPVDSSFSSQPDDFGSTKEIADFDDSQLSPSLLYCLDGNEPHGAANNAYQQDDDDDDILYIHELEDDDNKRIVESQLYHQLGALNARKRRSEDCSITSTGPCDAFNSNDDKENRSENVASGVEFGTSKKVIIVFNQPGETSF